VLPAQFPRLLPYLAGAGGAVIATFALAFSPWESRLDTTALVYLSVVVAAAGWASASASGFSVWRFSLRRKSS
jgi:hypothetical protein